MWASQRVDLGDYIPFTELVGYSPVSTESDLMSKFFIFILRSSLMRKKTSNH